MHVPTLAAGFALLAGLCVPAPAHADAAALVVADFEESAPGKFPTGWDTRDRAVAEGVYHVVEEGDGRYLAASAHAASAQIGRSASHDLAKYPLLSWRWRIHKLPPGGNEREKKTNDSAAGVYVVFKGSFGGLVPRALKYVWSTTQPVGASFPSPGYRNARIVVLRSGSADAGDWHQEHVDVAADYRRLFEEDPPELRGIAVLTDSDGTGSAAAADYDDFRALPRQVGEAAAPFP
jgi:hypothetical protein